jgi:hypothetical protein
MKGKKIFSFPSLVTRHSSPQALLARRIYAKQKYFKRKTYFPGSKRLY